MVSQLCLMCRSNQPNYQTNLVLLVLFFLFFLFFLMLFFFFFYFFFTILFLIFFLPFKTSDSPKTELYHRPTHYNKSFLILPDVLSIGCICLFLNGLSLLDKVYWKHSQKYSPRCLYLCYRALADLWSTCI